MARKRLILHAGLPKTGTSALQELLYGARETLMTNGTWYPDAVISGQFPYHRFLISELSDNPPLPKTKEILDKASTLDINQVILSIEGLTSHIVAIREDSAAAFDQLTRDWDVEIVVVTRDETKWRPSLYRQCVISPRLENRKSTLEQLYATSLSCADFANLEAIKDLSSRTAMVRKYALLFPKANVVFLNYEDNFIDDFSSRYGIDKIIAAANAPRTNSMPDDHYIEIIRQVNGLGLPSRINDLLRAAVASQTKTSNLHLQSYQEILTDGPGSFRDGWTLFKELGGLNYQQNSPMKTNARSFNRSRRAVRLQVLKTSANRALASRANNTETH